MSPRRTSQEKAPWKQLELTELKGATVEAEHVFDVHLGESITPYLALEPLKAALPLSRGSGQLVADEQGWYGVSPLELGNRMRRRWRTINELWEKHKGSNNELSLLERIDYVGNLRTQALSESGPAIRVVYTTSGRATAAILMAPQVGIDTSLYGITCNGTEEARYLVAVINSNCLDEQLAPLMPKGQFGARHVHKHLWRLPIPGFDDSDSLHVELAEAGEAAAIGAKALWDEVRVEREAKGQSTSVTVARREIRKRLSESAEGQRVEELVSRLLGG